MTTEVMERNAAPQNNILLESGTNELEILVFNLNGQSYGVNVAKVREVIVPQRMSASPNQPDSVLGIFNLRGVIHTLISLNKFLEIPEGDTATQNQKIIVTEFNGIRAAFRVDGVDHIHRLSWQMMRHVPDTFATNKMAVTGIIEVNGQMVLMLDFESIVDHILIQDDLRIESVENSRGVDRQSVRIVLAEDSAFMRNIIETLLARSGYTNVTAYPDGQKAFDALQACAAGSSPIPEILISDIEMPQMDGLTLTRQVKEDPALKQMRVVLFSSLVSEDNLHKGVGVGADAQLTKPQLANLVAIIDGWVKPE